MNNLFKQSESPGSPNLEQAAISAPLAPGREQTMTDKGTRVNPKDFVASTTEAFNDGATYKEKAALIKSDMVAISQQKERNEFIELVGSMDTFNWKDVKPHIMAQILTKIPYRGKRDEPPYYLSLTQALVFAMEAYRMGLSPLSNQCFFNRDSNKVNATLEGKKQMARDQGFNFGPPRFVRQEKEFLRGKSVPGFTKDVGITCSMAIKGFEDRAEYTAWLSEWYVSTSPVWREKPEHMLQTRAQEKCISSASGVGASELPSENDLQPPVSGLPEIHVTDFKEAQ